MKRISLYLTYTFLTSVFICFACAAYAEDSATQPVPEIFATLSKKAAGHRIQMTFTFVSKLKNGNTASGCGTILYQDGAYSFISDGYKVYNNKETLVTVNEVAREVVIEPGSSTDLLADPVALMSLFGANAKGAKFTTRKDSAGKPVGFDVLLRDGTPITVYIPSVKLSASTDLKDFSVDRSGLDPSFVITDLTL